jgi:hypothetical protein
MHAYHLDEEAERSHMMNHPYEYTTKNVTE